MQEFFADPLQRVAELDPVFTIVGFFLTVLSIAYAVYSHRISKVVAHPIVYYWNDTQISKLSNENRKIKVSYEYKEVEQVTLTRVRFWNAGRRVIKREDIPDKEPLIFRLADVNDQPVHILDYSILKTTPGVGAIKLTYTEDYSGLLMDFDYLDSKGGVVIDVQHTGDEHSKPELEGRILGPKKKTSILTYSQYEPINRWLMKKMGRERYEFVNKLSLIILFSILLILFPVFSVHMPEDKKEIYVNTLVDSLVTKSYESVDDSLAMKEYFSKAIQPVITKDPTIERDLKFYMKIVGALIFMIVTSLLVVRFVHLGPFPKSLRLDRKNPDDP